MPKLIIGIAGGLLVALAAGWIWGSSGQSNTARALQSAELGNELLGARAAALDARIAIYSVNFGEASRHLEDARGLLQRAEVRLSAAGRGEDLKLLQAAFAALDDAQRLAGKLDQSANSRAGDVAKIIADLLEAEARLNRVPAL